MSDGEFAYNHFTLDELRSLAASPQVGTMQAMPQSFRALADRVGEVADLLTHAQADLPNWWKGPAADQAAATLGRAAAEAREFHDSAMGAATAVSRCAQVVAEQQHQMMNVPDMPEPGVTDAVQRPATPLEALEAARQDARYQAAHEQAVQVVNGIAAQYVETRGQLESTNFFRSENFSALTGANGFSSTSPQPLKDASFESQEVPRQARETSSVQNLESTLPVTLKYATSTSKDVATKGGQARSLSAISGSSASITSASSSLAGSLSTPAEETASPPIQELDAIRPTHDAVTPFTSSPISEEPSGHLIQASDPRYEMSPIPALEPLKDRTPSQSDTSQATALADEAERPATLARANMRLPRSTNELERSQTDTRQFTSAAETNQQASSAIEPSGPSQSLPAESPNAESLNEGDATIVPPYSGIGSIRSEREHRNPRPPYLKERKSAWLPDTFAAPPDGVIGPAWSD